MDEYNELNDKLKVKLSKYGDKSRFMNAIQLMQNVSVTLPKLKKEINEDVITPKKLLLKKLIPNNTSNNNHFLPNIDKNSNRAPVYQVRRSNRQSNNKLIGVSRSRYYGSSPKLVNNNNNNNNKNSHHNINISKRNKNRYMIKNIPTVENRPKNRGLRRDSSVSSSSYSSSRSSDLEDDFLNEKF